MISFDSAIQWVLSHVMPFLHWLWNYGVSQAWGLGGFVWNFVVSNVNSFVTWYNSPSPNTTGVVYVALLVMTLYGFLIGKTSSRRWNLGSRKSKKTIETTEEESSGSMITGSHY